MKPQSSSADKAASDGCVSRLVRFSSSSWGCWDRWEPFDDWVASLVFKQAIVGITIGWSIAVMIAVILSWLMPIREPHPQGSPVSPPTSRTGLTGAAPSIAADSIRD